MSIDVALHHRTTYRYDRLVGLAPHVVRLRPAPHARTRIISYSQKVTPAEHFINWQQDPFSNYLARLVFPERTRLLQVEVDLIARMEAINPFDFFLEERAQTANFGYDSDTTADLAPYLTPDPAGPMLRKFLSAAPQRQGPTIDFLVDINQYVQNAIGYIVRMEPGVQTPEETLTSAKGSCRDSGWLLVQMLRHMGFAARFVSGYLIQLTADLKAVDGPSGPEEDFTDLHAWTEIYLPGAGWVGLDPTSGLFAGEGHIPLAATPNPRSAAPITGALDPAEVTFDVEMTVTRVSEPPRSTRPLDDSQWARVMAAGHAVDDRLRAHDVRLTVGGEPTFVSATDRDAGEWTIDAVGPTKRAYADKLIRRLRDRFAPGGALHYGQGKWYPGEQLPRWAFELHWRGDGAPLWRDPSLIATEDSSAPSSPEDAERFIKGLCEHIGVEADHAQPAYEDPAEFALREQNLPTNRTPENNTLSDPEARRRLVRVFERGLEAPAAFVLPIQLAQAEDGGRTRRWMTELWQTRRGKLFLVPGDSPAGLRLPLEALPYLPPGMRPLLQPVDPFSRRMPLPPRFTPPKMQQAAEAEAEAEAGSEAGGAPQATTGAAGTVIGAVRTALTVEPRQGRLCVFLPPVAGVEDYVALVNAVEDVAEAQGVAVHVEGYPPPPDPRLNVIRVTPDPGVIEVNVQPAHNWSEQVNIIEVLYEEARAIGLDSSTFQIDGRPTGSGGGNHIVMGGAQAEDSPFLRRPDLLASIIRYWQNHPSLSYLFSGMFVGPTSQAPRIDEARHDALFEMEIALEQLPAAPGAPPWLVDRLFRDLLTDVTGNTHRAEICIDKLYSPDGPTGRLGLVEFRAFEMPPHPRMAAAQALMMRALIAWFWEKPYQGDLKRWGTTLHDRFLLPHFVAEDFRAVLGEVSQGLGIELDPEWFAAQLAFRFPVAGVAEIDNARLELTHAIEPWPVLGEQGAIGGTTRFVDSSLERLQVRVEGAPEGAVVTCNGIAVPLVDAGDGSRVAGVRFRAWHPARCLHQTIRPHVPLRFDLADPALGRSLGGCTYHAAHPGGRSHEDRPINELEAEGRRLARFQAHHTPGPLAVRTLPVNPEFPLTLDLRRA